MPPMLNSLEIIETLVALHCGEHGSLREKYLYREMLRNLVRLAQAEKTEINRMEIFALPPTYDDESVVH